MADLVSPVILNVVKAYQFKYDGRSPPIDWLKWRGLSVLKRVRWSLIWSGWICWWNDLAYAVTLSTQCVRCFDCPFTSDFLLYHLSLTDASDFCGGTAVTPTSSLPMDIARLMRAGVLETKRERRENDVREFCNFS
ncbi:hypothetical protein J6590_039021 [Homalodisca vitripennis]|nr:hypothetical protein J6590_039021 [Homalodisca vitripennis]